MLKSFKTGHKSILLIMTIALCLMIGVAAGSEAMAAEDGQYSAVENADFSDFSMWKSGWYNSWDGKYGEKAKWLCYSEYLTVTADSYKVTVGSPLFLVQINEYNSSNKLIGSVKVADGALFIPADNTVYLSVTLMRSTTDWIMNYDAFHEMFDEGFSVSFAANMVYENAPAEENNDMDGASEHFIDLSDFSKWQTGWYNTWNGQYGTRAKVICSLDPVEVLAESYKIELSDSNFSLQVVEADANQKFIRYVVLQDGDTYIPSSNAAGLKLDLFKTEADWTMTYDKFAELFAAGFSVRLLEEGSVNTQGAESVSSEESAVTSAPVITATPTPTVLPTAAPTMTPTPAPTAEPEKEYASFRDELKDMLENGDAKVHDISKYNLTFARMNAVYEELVKGECYVTAKAYIDVYYTTTKSASGIIQTFQLKNVDDDFAYRYEKLKAVREEALSFVKPEMSDAEKVLVLHDFIMEKAYYANGIGASAVVGPLVYGRAICAGYTNALIFLLHEVGIESYYLSSNPMNHAWVLVKVDGEFYHLDLTWDDYKGGRHCYFLCNDNEFMDHEVQNHYGWVSYEINATSTSTRFENWFVHDVKGKMVYLDGYWYFAEGNVVKMATIDGNVMKVVATESGDVTIREVKDGLVYYTVDGITKSTR